MSVLEVQNLTYTYSQGTPFQKDAVRDVSFSLNAGELVGVIGHTGSGKSTLVQQLNGLMKPTSGRVLLDGQDIHADEKRLRKVRFSVGLVFQYPEYQLFDETVYKDISFGPRNMELPEEEIDRRVHEAAGLIALPEELLQKSPFDLSGGEKRRAAIAGVLAMEPQVLILDEPTAGLDPAGRRTILKLIRDYREKTGAAVVFVSHSMEDVAAVAERVLVLNGGRLVMDGPSHEIFSHAAELQKMGLNIPKVTEIFLKLKEYGLPVSAGIYTVADGVAELLRLRDLKGGSGRA